MAAYDAAGDLIASRTSARDQGYPTTPADRTRYSWRVPGYQTVYGDIDKAWEMADRMHAPYLIEMTMHEKMVKRK